jgi:hypothetical protein
VSYYEYVRRKLDIIYKKLGIERFRPSGQFNAPAISIQQYSNHNKRRSNKMEDELKDTRKQFINNEFLPLVESSQSFSFLLPILAFPMRTSETNCYFEKNERKDVYIYGVKDCNMNIQLKFLLFASISAALLLFSLGRRQRKTNTHRHVHPHIELSPYVDHHHWIPAREKV